ncbi:MAG: SMP-30/gluconolactonase/LRE family protein [Planctomycetota bacterium]
MSAALFSLILGSVLFCALAAGEGGIATSELERVATGFQFTEGPVWLPDGYLAFSDIPADTIYKLEGPQPEVFRRPSGNANGLTVANEDRLVACEHGNRRVSLTQRNGSVVALATHYAGKRLNSPNDIVVKSDGSIYFTDPPYGVPEADRELDFQGVYRASPDGDLTLLADDFVKPNGLAFSPDEKVLYIDDTDQQWVRAFDLRGDGLLENSRVFIPVVGRPDGMKVDTEGNVYVAATEGVWIASAEGEHLHTIAVPERPSNLAFGGPDGRTLYVTARTSVYRIAVKHPGAVMSRRLARKEP